MIKPISAPSVVRRSLAGSTTTIRNTDINTGIRPQQAELLEVLKITLSLDQQVEHSAAITSAQDNIEGRQKWAMSSDNTITSFEQQYENSVFWSYWEANEYVAPAAASAAAFYVQEAGGRHAREVFNPGIIVAADTIRFVDIAEETDAQFTYSPFGFELMSRLVQVDAASLGALLSRGDLFL